MSVMVLAHQSQRGRRPSAGWGWSLFEELCLPEGMLWKRRGGPSPVSLLVFCCEDPSPGVLVGFASALALSLWRFGAGAGALSALLLAKGALLLLLLGTLLSTSRAASSKKD